MADMKKQIYLEDGRIADQVVQEVADNGEHKVVTEVWAEPRIEKKLVSRVVDYTKPVIYKREIETVDEVTGNVVERKVESIEPEVRRELREHITTNDSISALNTTADCDCYVTQEDMQKCFAEGLLTFARMIKEADNVTASPGVSMQSLIGEKIEATKNALAVDNKSKFLWGAIALVAGLFAYIVFLM